VDLPKEDTLNMVELDFNYLATNKATMIEKWNTLWAKTH
jgi:hypothetical protein